MNNRRAEKLYSSDIIPPEPSPVAPKVQRLEQLDALRGLAALNVLIAHFFSLYLQLPPWVLILGRTPCALLFDGRPAVLLFFMLSGFVLYLPYGKSEAPYYGRFMVRRACRIYLPYLAGVAFAAIASMWRHHPVAHISAAFGWEPLTTAQSEREALLFLSLVLPFSMNAWNSSLWTIAEEIRVSIIFPPLAKAIRRMHWMWILLCILSMSLLSGICISRVHHYFPFMTLHYAAIFAFGAALAKYRATPQAWMRKLGAWNWLLLPLCPALMHLGMSMRPAGAPYSVLYQMADLVAAVGIAPVLIAALELRSFRDFLMLPPLQTLGRTSYSFYLFHLPILFLSARLLWERFPPFVTFFATLLGALVMAIISYRWIELPSIALGRRLTGVPSRKTPAQNA